MSELITLTKAQEKVVANCNKALAKAGLPTYSEVENRGAMLGLAAFESLEMGKQLIAKLQAVDAEIARLRRERL